MRDNGYFTHTFMPQKAAHYKYQRCSNSASGHQDRREGGAEGVTVRGPGDTGGPAVLNCQV